MTGASALADLDRALAAAAAIVAGIRPGQWLAPTPCPGLSVRDVVSHVVSGNLLFAAIVRGGPPPDRGADHLGDDPPAAFRDAGARLLQAFTGPGVMETVYRAPFGSGPGSVLLGVRIVEVLAHGWDLARATGQRADFPDDVAERALAGARRQLTDRPAGPSAPFGPEVAVPDGAPAVDRLAGFLGRPV